VSDGVQHAVGAALITANVLASGLLVARLRRPIRLAAAPILAGALGPVVAVAAYLVVTHPAFNGATALVAATIGAVVGAATTINPETWPTGAGPMVRRSLTALVLCGGTYLAGIAAPTVLITPEGRALGALLAIGSCGVAVGAAIALLVRVLMPRPIAESPTTDAR
jgi:hypothetical protein